MIKGNSVLALIIARGGSEGLHRKNILPLVGKPLIAWSIETALKSKYVDRCIVSTDDKEIAATAEKYGADIPFMRPKELATAESTGNSVIKHAILHLQDLNQLYKYTILLEPTSPLTETSDVDAALEKLIDNRKIADAIVGCSKVEYAHPVYDARINKNGLVEPYIGKIFKNYRRQDIEDLYYFDGSLYISDSNNFIENESFFHSKTLPYIVPRWKSFEIDSIVDFICVEAIINNLDKFQK